MVARVVKILGLDPGLRHTGWGLISTCANALTYVDCGVINTPANLDSMADRLTYLHENLKLVIERLHPHEAVVEETFVNQNPASALKLGMARGIVLMTPCQAGVPVFSYTANMVKKSVVGAGHADKDQVMMMVKRFMPTIPLKISHDAADALAVAICHAHHRQMSVITQALRQK